MASIPPILGRVPNSLITQLSRDNITTAREQLLRTQVQLSSALRVFRPSDDPVASSLITVLDRQLETGAQQARNLSNASSVLGSLDSAFSILTEQVIEAKEVALSQIGIGSDAETRRTQATVVDSLLDGIVTTLNRDFAGIHLFSGAHTGVTAIERFGQGFRYAGQGEGLRTDLGGAIDFPITVGAGFAAGAVSARLEGDIDLDPRVSAATLVRNLRGPSSSAPTLGSLTITIDNGTPQSISVDLSNAETLGDVATAIESGIRNADPAALGGAFPSAVGFATDRFSIGGISAGYTITFSDGPAGTTARDLGLGNFTFDSANAVSTDPNADLDPTITDRTVLGDLNPITPLVYGQIRFRSAAAQGTVTTSATMTVGDLKEQVDRLGLGVRVEISDDGRSIDVHNDISGRMLSIEEVGSLAATTLGIRSYKGTTDPGVFNAGRGVEIADGEIDPITGLPDPARNVDFEVTLTNGSTFNVDLTPADMGSVAGIVARINADAASAGLGAVVTAQLVSDGNGIELVDSSGGAGATSVRSLNGFAAEDLGLLSGTFSPGAPARLIAEDRARIRVDSILSTLTDLRDALLTNDELGIKFAGERLEADLERIVQGRAVVGARAARIDDETRRLEDTTVMDESIRSSLRDLDMVEASLRFSTLQAQLAAANQTAAAVSQLTLLNFLR